MEWRKLEIKECSIASIEETIETKACSSSVSWGSGISWSPDCF